MKSLTKSSTNPGLDLFLIQLAGKYSISKKYSSGETICEEGERGNSMLLILTGSVKIVKQSSLDGALVQIGARGVGEFLGEMALVEELPRSATVIAETDCEVLEFSKDNFEKVIQEQPALATRVLRSLSNKLRESDSHRISELEENNKILNATNEELVRLNAFLDCVIDRSPSAVFLATRAGQIFRLNAAATKMFELAEPGNRFVVDDLFKDFALKEFRKNPEKSWHGEVTALRENEEFPAYLSVATLTGHNESLLHLLICQDISELQAFNRAIKEFEKYTTAQQTAAELAHDLKNLLGVLLGNVDLVLHQLTDEQKEKMDKTIQAIRQVSKETHQFAEDIMAYREEEGEFQPIDIRSMVKAVIRFCKLQGIFKDITLDFSVSTDFPRRLDVKEGQIQSVIVNLLTNAAEALAADSGKSYRAIQIDLSYDPGSHCAVIRTLDNGPGIEPKLQSKLFKERVTTKKQGHGIGLVSIGRIIQNHNGQISVETHPGQGTTFEIRLPVEREQHDA